MVAGLNAVLKGIGYFDQRNHRFESYRGRQAPLALVSQTPIPPIVCVSCSDSSMEERAAVNRRTEDRYLFGTLNGALQVTVTSSGTFCHRFESCPTDHRESRCLSPVQTVDQFGGSWSTGFPQRWVAQSAEQM